MEFFKQYTIKGEKDPIGTEEEFLRLRNGACIVKSTGEEYIKQEDHVFNKSSRQYYSKVEADNNFASLSKQNTFLDKQLTNVAITESNQLTTKAYVDKTVNDAKVDTSVFANIHKANIFDEIQTCAEKPSSRAHLVNKAYVDDSIDNIVFDTSNLANVNKSNTFTDPQTCLADPLNQYHLTNKKYVDAAIAQVNGDTSTFVRYNTKNHFEDDQTFNYRLILNHEPTEKNDAVTLNYLNKKVEGLNLSQYAKLNERNTFTEDQTFSGYVYCNNRPVFDNQLANKKYVDESLGNISVNGAVAYTNRDNQFSVQQTFLAPVVVQNPVGGNNPATKAYVDSRIQSAGIAYANTEVQGTVKLSYGLDAIKTDVLRVPTESQVAMAVQNIKSSISNLDAKTVKLAGTNSISASNTFSGENSFENTIDGVTTGTLAFHKDIDDSNSLESRWYYNNNADFGLQHVKVTYPEDDDADPIETNLGTTRLVSSGNVFTLSRQTNLGYGTNNNFVPDKSALAFWNGAYNGTTSNLLYSANGEIIGSNNIGSQSVKHATSANSATNATNATNADIATRLKGYDNHNSIYLGWDGNNLTMNVDNVDSTKGVVITHKNISSQSVKHATTANSATNANHATSADSATTATNDSSNRNIVNTYALKSNYPDRIKFAWDTTFKGYVNVTVDKTTWGLITSQNISSQSVKYANSADNANKLGGYPATDYIRSVNGVKASENGNVTIPLPFVKTVNSTAPDSNGNVVLDLSSSGGGVGFPDLSAGVAITNLNGNYTSSTTRIYTLPSDGWVIGSLIIPKSVGGSSIVSIYLNNNLQMSYHPASEYHKFDFSMSLKSGSQITIQFNHQGNNIIVSSSLKFYPFLR